MPVSVHKLLVHGSQVIKSLLLIGILSEEAQEASNKNYKRFREHHTRRNSRTNTTRDLMYMLLVSSDPVIFTRRGVPKTKENKLPQDVLLLLNIKESTIHKILLFQLWAVQIKTTKTKQLNTMMMTTKPVKMIAIFLSNCNILMCLSIRYIVSIQLQFTCQ